jgi:hypothetical protein
MTEVGPSRTHRAQSGLQTFGVTPQTQTRAAPRYVAEVVKPAISVGGRGQPVDKSSPADDLAAGMPVLSRRSSN